MMKTQREAVSTLCVTHIFDGEEIVTAGEDGQTWIATFAEPAEARNFIAYKKAQCEWVMGERSTNA